ISDADTLDCENFVAELAAYLKVLEINRATDVTLVADGAAWIWSYVPPMLNSLGVSPECVTEIMDMTHARQNLSQALDLCTFGPLASRYKVADAAFELIKGADIVGLEKLLLSHVRKGSKKVLKRKMQGYFFHHKARMQYNLWKDIHPRGSGCVESAIRRVINLRIKAPGSFWKLPTAAAMIFLRSKLLYGRWQTLIGNWLASKRFPLNAHGDEVDNLKLPRLA
ncbi:MAG: hypothetical protein GY799_00845, partial [Desulfobulbaceae bacterium]|nr:hypothetical protein [Desulfobulbaceae bacterium]